ncbi:linoleate 10R-lipoxygenase, partial [Lecanoromycetidae sp. Uapishka_2]
MFNRFHNYTVEQLGAINESGRFTKPKDGATAEALAQYDNDLFQTARLINCGLYINIILKDYVRTILELNRTNSDWDLDPRTTKLTGPTANGTPGNQVSAEFNLVYRWHAAVSERDDEWTQQEYKRLFPGKEPTQVTLPELLQGLGQWEQGLSEDPQKRPFANLDRLADGTLSDDALVKILTESIEDKAGAFGSRNIPEILRSVEILGIKQARSWNLATLNEFRAFFNLTKHETFESINSDPEIADALRHFYDDPDLVEIYPGLVVEETKPSIRPGSGLSTDYTISRTILSDAVALVRGDRFYMVDNTPNSLTNWGFSEIASDLAVDHGHVLYKLFLRAFPNHFRQDSVYAHYPFVIPAENRVILTDLEQIDKYNFDRPAYRAPPTFITSYAACTSILANQLDFKVTWGEAIKFLMHNGGREYGADFMLAGDSPPNATSRAVMASALYRQDWIASVKTFYEEITFTLLRDKSYKIGKVNQVDIVRDVGNLAQVHFAAELGEIMETVVVPEVAHASLGIFEKVVGLLHKEQSALSSYGAHMIQQLFKSGLSAKDIIWSQILPTAGGMVANQGQLFAQCLDFYLQEGNVTHLTEINRLAKLDTSEADDLILR